LASSITIALSGSIFTIVGTGAGKMTGGITTTEGSTLTSIAVIDFDPVGHMARV